MLEKRCRAITKVVVCLIRNRLIKQYNSGLDGYSLDIFIICFNSNRLDKLKCQIKNHKQSYIMILISLIKNSNRLYYVKFSK